MGLDVTIAVPTYGGDEWIELANERALRSASHFGVPVLHVHGEEYQDAHDLLLAEIRTEWVVHLDADDELETGYLDAMARGSADIRAPALNYVDGPIHSVQRARRPRHTHRCQAECLREGNWVCKGAAVRTSLLRRAGGFRYRRTLDDWDCWLRCWRLGATVEPIDDAVYVIHINREGMSWSAVGEVERRTYETIRKENEWAGIIPR